MVRFYFDCQDGRATIDDHGEEFPDVEAAKHEACLVLGEMTKEFLSSCEEGQLAVRIRDQRGPILEITANIQAKPLAK